MSVPNDVNKSSMCYWWPRIRGLPIPQPLTVIVPVPVQVLLSFVDQGIGPLEPFVPELEEAGSKIGYPLFLRTDHLSNKHDWENSCYVKQEQDLMHHIAALIYMSFAIFGPPPSALVFRQYVPLASRFTAFRGNMPIAPERRYFIRNGSVQCHHPYQPPDSIRSASVPNWHELLVLMNRVIAAEIPRLTAYAELVGMVLKGYWSMDFALAADGRWLLIDCAEGEKSYHWKECKHASSE